MGLNVPWGKYGIHGTKSIKKLGYFNGWASRKFGDNLKRSVIKYQKSSSFKVTGTVCKTLYDVIRQECKDKLKEEQIEFE